MDNITQIRIEELKSDTNFDLINFSNSEFIERHPGSANIPKQVPMTFSTYDALIKFLRKYFKHFGIDVSYIDDRTLMTIVKTVNRMESVSAYRRGYNECRKKTPSFHDQLVDYFNNMADMMEEDSVPWTDFIPEGCKMHSTAKHEV